jgi:hypothetical protein
MPLGSAGCPVLKIQSVVAPRHATFVTMADCRYGPERSVRPNRPHSCRASADPPSWKAVPRTVPSRVGIPHDKNPHGGIHSARSLGAAMSGVAALDPLSTDTLDGDDGAMEDGDLGGERPNDQRGAGGAGERRH